MPVESINTPLQAFTYIGSNLIILLTVVSILTFLFLKLCAERALLKERSQTNHVTLDNLFDTLKEGELKEVGVIIKADVQGSVEALAQSFKKIDVEGVRVNIIHQAVGAINESDVTLAEASNAIIVGFNVRPTPLAKQQAESDNVDIRLHRVIYKD